MKFILLNDLEYLLCKRKKFFFLILLVPFFYLLLNIKADLSSIHLLEISMGTAIDFKQADIIEILMYLFNIFIFIFLFMDVYMKDFLYQMDNLFVRIPFYKWFYKKSFLFIIITFFIKIIQYTLLCITLLIVKEKMGLFTFFQLLIKDYLYIVFSQFWFFLVFLLIIIGQKIGKIIGLILFFAVIIVIPKNISSISLFIVLFIFLVQGVLLLLFKKIPKRIMENI